MNFTTRLKAWIAARVRYQLIVLIFFVSAVVYIDRSNISIAGIYLAEDYGIDNIQLGWVFSAFLWGYAAFQIPAGWLVGKLGPRKTLTFGLIWWSALSVVTALVPSDMAHSLWVLIAVRFILGMGEAVAYPSSNQFIAAWFPSAERGLANGWVFGGVGMGSGLAPPLVALIIYNWGWHAVFYASAGVGLVIAAIWYLAARDTPAQHTAVKPAELGHIRAGQQEKIEGPIGRVPWLRIFTSVDVWGAAVAYVAFCYVAFIFHTWFFTYLKQGRGLDLKSSAILAMLPFIGMVMGSLIGGWISDRMVKRFGQYVGRSLWGAFTLFLAGAFLIVGSHAQNTTVAVLVLAGGAGACYLGQATYWAFAADYGGPYTGVISGLINMAGQIAGATTAILTPLFAKWYGWEFAFYVAAGICFVCMLPWFVVNPNRRLHVAEPVIA
ncbi:MAG TPA: MFS transporter [Rhizomicrobium sp.]|nr:MFS transporter [Rhizomicrobium sp.]